MLGPRGELGFLRSVCDDNANAEELSVRISVPDLSAEAQYT